MNIIKFWRYMCLAWLGQLSESDVDSLILVMSDSNFSLKYRARCQRVFTVYCRRNVPSKDLLRKIYDGVAIYTYLENIGKRSQPLTDDEQQLILELPDYCINHLSRALTTEYAIKLLQWGDEDVLMAYLEKFKLSVAAERYLETMASSNHDVSWLAVHYVTAHNGEVFQKPDAQQFLFELPHCEKIQQAIIECSSMENPLLLDSSIENLITDASKKQLLLLFLSHSYVANPQLIELLKKRAQKDKQMSALLCISVERKKLFEKTYSTLWNDDVSSHLEAIESEIIATLDAEKRRQLVMEQIVPKMKENKTSPAMAAWVAYTYPHLAQIAAENVQQFIRRIDGQIVLTLAYNNMRNQTI